MTGREKESELLEGMLRDDKSHFVAVYGRRRIGKTYLIREVFQSRFTFQHAGVYGGDLKEQIFAFEASIKESGGVSNRKTRNWMEAFEDLKDLIRVSTEKRKVVFLDELSWMDTRNSDLMMALESFWNGWASARSDIILIICASATSWMLSKVVHNKGGLYNRLTEQIHLEALSLKDCEDYVRSNNIAFNRSQILQYYMIFGGVPFYWTFIRKGLSLAQNIDNILFAKDAPLKEEYDYLFSSI
ncbi:MAG: AAA family ATPase, partial [Lachnospiraceae bacterium]|nr:AAA family ATPase [Lachnospiraceae bacterium]